MNTRLSSIFSIICDLVLPPRATELVVRALTLDDLRSARSVDTGSLPYHDKSATALVWEVKYYANRRAVGLCGAFIAEILMDIATEELGKPLLIPVPMHPARRKKRGHNQTELLCESALRQVHDLYDYQPRALARVADTPPQQGLPSAKRRVNLHKTMNVLDKERIAGRVCVVVDDVSTTGATFREATRALKKAGARKVHCVALAQS